jgi:chemotaxis protein CheD
MSGSDIQLFEYYLQPGYIFLNEERSLISTVLGSSVAVSLWDQKKEYGGMANYLYPFVNHREQATAQYGNVAIRHLVKMFSEEGAKEKNIKAQIFGGAATESPECANVARENVSVARRILNKLKIEVISEDVGGNLGRKIVFNTFKNEAIVYKVSTLRDSDWYPYLYERDRNR